MQIRTAKYVIILLIILIALVVFSSAIGSANLSLKLTFKTLISVIPGIRNLINISSINPQDFKVIFDIRLPRILVSILVGIALSGSGVIFQGIFRNPMADPYIIGVSAGAAFGATIGLLFAGNIKIISLSATSIFAFFGAIGTTF